MTGRVPGLPRARRLILLAILAVAAFLRFDGLGWGLRHPPHPDERVFVRNAALMLAAGDLDHRYYEYPGLFVYLLAGTMAAAGVREGAPAFLAGRALVATFGVVSVLLAYRLGKQQAGVLCGLGAAALLAISPVEVRTAHMIRPDVVLETFTLLGLLALGRLDARPGRVALAGAAYGAATAVKFSGALFGLCVVLRILALESHRVRALVIAGLASLAAFVALSPYTFLAGERSSSGAALQFSFYLVRRAATDLSGLLVEAHYFVMALGVAGAVLATAGLVLASRAMRHWAHVAALPLVFGVVFATTTGRAERYILPSLGAAAVLAAFAFEHARRRVPASAAPLGLLVLAPPAVESGQYLNALRQPRTQDLVADWLDAHLPAGARVRNSVDTPLGLPPRLEQTLYARSQALDPRVGLGFDAVVTGIPGPADAAGRVAFEAIPVTPYSGPGLRVSLADPARLVPVPAAAITVTAPHGPLDFEQPGTLEIALDAPRRLASLELVTPDRAFARAELDVRVRRVPGGALVPARVDEGRPVLDEQQGVASRVLLFDGAPVAGVELRVRPRRGGFSVTELRLAQEAPR